MWCFNHQTYLVQLKILPCIHPALTRVWPQRWWRGWSAYVLENFGRLGTVQPREVDGHPCVRRECVKVNSHFSEWNAQCWVLSDRIDNNGLKHSMLHLNIWKLLLWGQVSTGIGCPEVVDCPSLQVLKYLDKILGVCKWPCSRRVLWTRWLPYVSFNLKDPVIQMYT